MGWQSLVGSWTRIEGTPTELDPDRSHATTDNFYLFDDSGKLLPSKKPNWKLKFLQKNN